MQPKTLEWQRPSTLFHAQDHPFPARREMHGSKFDYNNHLSLFHNIILTQCETGDNCCPQSKNNCKEQDVMCLKLWRIYTRAAWLQKQTIVLFFPSDTTLSPAWYYVFNICSFKLHGPENASQLKQLPCALTMLHWRTVRSPARTSVLSCPKQSKTIFLGLSGLQEAEHNHFEKNWLYQSRDHLSMVLPELAQPPTPYRDPSTTRQWREVEKTSCIHILFTTHTTKTSWWRGFKSVIRSFYS